MEKGTGPIPEAQIDTQALIDWAERKGAGPALGIYVAEEKLPEEGITANPYLKPAAERMQAWIQNRGFDL